MCGQFTQERPASGTSPRSSAPRSRSLTTSVGDTTSLLPTRPWSSSSATNDGRDRLPVGSHPPLGRPGEGRLADVQRTRRDASHESGVSRSVRSKAMPRTGRLVLRMETRGHDPAALPCGPARLGRCWSLPGCGQAGAIPLLTPSGGRSRSSRRPRTTPLPISRPDARRAFRRRMDALARSATRGSLGTRGAPGPQRDRRAQCARHRFVNDVRRDGPELIAPLA